MRFRRPVVFTSMRETYTLRQNGVRVTLQLQQKVCDGKFLFLAVTIINSVVDSCYLFCQNVFSFRSHYLKLWKLRHSIKSTISSTEQLFEMRLLNRLYDGDNL